MDTANNAAISPTPDDDEAAAIIAALVAYLAEQRCAPAPPARTVSSWALAGRLASHGLPTRRVPGARINWANAGRKR